jgi:hypothetical protein
LRLHQSKPFNPKVQIMNFNHHSSMLSVSGLCLVLGAASLGCVAGVEDPRDPAPGTASSELIGPTGLVHRWTFDEAGGSSALDTVGGTTGTLGSSASRVSSFDGSGAVSLDANGFCDQASYVDFGSSIGQFGTADFTVSHWLNTSYYAPGTLGDILGNRVDGSNGNFFAVRMNGFGQLTLELDDGGANYTGLGGGPLVNDGAWHHIAYSRSGAVATLYIDGVAVGSASSYSGGITNLVTPVPFHAGRTLDCQYGNYATIPALFDDLRVYDHQLSACEVALLAGNTSVCTPVCTTIRRGGAGNVADTKLRADQPNTNFGALNTFVTGDRVTGRTDLLQFDLTSIPAGKTITSATVTMTEILNSGPSTIAVHQATSAWSESTVTWNSFGNGFASAVETSFSNGGAGYTGPVSFDIAPLVQAWTSGAVTNNGVVLNATTNSTWSSSEEAVAAHRPSIDVCYLP